MSLIESTQSSITNVRKQTDSVMLFCSLGKDSIVLLDLIYPHFKRIVCVFMYFVKGLEHVERWVSWLKARYPKVEFVQVPHWNLTYVLRSGTYCVRNPKVKLLKLRDVVDAMRLKYKLHYCFLGMKKADSMNRNLMLKRMEDTHYENMGLVYPLAEWTQKNVLSYMKQHNLPSPVRYGKKASNGIGFNIDCFLWLRNNFPDDLLKIYKVFPMSQRILWEYDEQKRIEDNGEETEA